MPLAAQKAAAKAFVLTKRLNNAESARDTSRRQILAAKHLQFKANATPACDWSFVSGLDGTEGDSDPCDSRAATVSGQASSSAGVDADAAARHSTDGTPRGASVHAGATATPRAASLPASCKGERSRPRRANSSFCSRSVSSAISSLLGDTSVRQATRTGRGTGPALPPALSAS